MTHSSPFDVENGLAPLVRKRGDQTDFRHLGADRDNEYMMIDSTIVRAHQHSARALKRGADQAIGRPRGGLITKIQTTVDAARKVVALSLT